MLKKMTRSQSGFTLFELIIVVALLSIVLSLAFTFLAAGMRFVEKSDEQFAVQSASRLAMQKTSQAIRYSEAVFTIPSSALEEENLSAEWDYIGIETVDMDGTIGNEIVQYIYIYDADEDAYIHQREVIVPAQAGIVYNISFNRDASDSGNRSIEFTLKVSSVDEPDGGFEMTSEVIALNSMQIIDDLTTALDPAVGVAFRSGNSDPTVVKYVGHVAMVLDTSGSMDRELDGSSTNNDSLKRITKMKTAAQMIIEGDVDEDIDGFAQEDNIDVTIIPFNNNANQDYIMHDSNQLYYQTLLSSKNETDALVAQINALVAAGYTNTGDGLRRAYYTLLNNNTIPDVTVKNYMILLVDGVSTKGTKISGRNDPFDSSDCFVLDGDVASSQCVNEDDRTSYYVSNTTTVDPFGSLYVDTVGELLDTTPDFEVEVYIIGYASEINSSALDDIAAACGIDIYNAEEKAAHVFQAGDEAALLDAFEVIKDDISNQLWLLLGPGYGEEE